MTITLDRTNCPDCGNEVLITHTSTTPHRRVLVDVSLKIFCIIFDKDSITKLKGHEPHDQTCTGKEVV